MATMERILQFLDMIGENYPMEELKLIGMAAIHYSILLNFLNGTKGEQADESIKEVIEALSSVIKD